MTTEAVTPANWLANLIGVTDRPTEGTSAESLGIELQFRDGVWRSASAISAAQEATSDAFGYKWARRDTFESAASLARARAWLEARYGDVAGADWWDDLGEHPVLTDLGCGAGMSGLLLFGPKLADVRYLGVDVSAAVDVARTRFQKAEAPGEFLQADVTRLPIPDGSVSVVFAEGVFHHTDSTHRAIAEAARLLVSGGKILFYVYRQKGPIREFTDDLIRADLQGRDPDDAWAALYPLTRLGMALGELEATVDVPEDIPVLGISAGEIDVQRLFYWHVAKAFYDPRLGIEEMNHINFDWFSPVNAHRQSPAEVRSWCDDVGLRIDREVVEHAGITIIATKR